MAISGKVLTNALVERVGEHHLVKVEFEAWVIPGTEGVMVKAINDALTACVVVSDWGGPSVIGTYPDGEPNVIVP